MNFLAKDGTLLDKRSEVRYAAPNHLLLPLPENEQRGMAYE